MHTFTASSLTQLIFELSPPVYAFFQPANNLASFITGTKLLRSMILVLFLLKIKYKLLNGRNER